MKKFSNITEKQEIEIEMEVTLPNGETQPVLVEVIDGEEGVIPQPDEEPVDLVEEPIVGNEGSEVVKFFSKLFESREMAHVFHLQAKGGESSNAVHTALQTYYEDILDQIDTLIETYQGQHGIVDGYETIDTNVSNTEVLPYFEGLAEEIKHLRKSISEEDTHLHSIIDDIVCLIYQTLYRLKFIK